MPMYEYSCATCGNAFERRRPAAERNDAQACPSCGATEVILQMSAPAVHGARSLQAMGTCPTSGKACGCAHAIRN
jgi:putative FmdB family regulatory protein